VTQEPVGDAGVSDGRASIRGRDEATGAYWKAALTMTMKLPYSDTLTKNVRMWRAGCCEMARLERVLGGELRDTFSFAERADAPASRIGGNGAGLADLVRRGQRVPNGFVITCGAYRSAIRQASLDRRIASILEPGDPVADAVGLSSRVTALFEPLAVPDDVARDGRGHCRNEEN
jgi:hypothetical protein